MITQSERINKNVSIAVQPRAIGAANLSVRVDEAGTTRIVNLRQSGSSKLVFPATHRPDVEATLINTAGGITGGDCFDLNVQVQENASLTVTTQTAERAYRAQIGEVAKVTTHLSVAKGGLLQWLPQELILFDRCALSRQLDIQLNAGAQLLMVEPIVFGRTMMRETLDDVLFRDRIKITRAGRPIYIDGMDLQGDAHTHLSAPATAGSAGAMTSVVMVSPKAEAQLNAVRAMLPTTAGASLLAPDMLVIRHLAPDSFDLRRSLLPVLNQLSNNTLPTSWRL